MAGKKCGAWRNWMRSTSGAWKTFWRLYEKPLSEEEPVVCIDEKPVVLHRDIRAPLPARPGTGGAARLRVQTLWHRQRLLRRRAESGAAFSQAHSPTARRRSLPITWWRSSPAIPRREPFTLVMDNLNTHGRKSLTEALWRKAGRLAVEPLHGPLHAQARQLAQPGRDRSEPAQPPVPGTTQNR